jgi:hypothetical protein
MLVAQHMQRNHTIPINVIGEQDLYLGDLSVPQDGYLASRSSFKVRTARPVAGDLVRI